MKSYKFIDLHPQSQLTVIKRLSEINIVDGWFAPIFESWNKKLESIGFNDSVISFDNLIKGNNDFVYKTLFSFSSFDCEKGNWVFEGSNIKPDDVNLSINASVLYGNLTLNISFSFAQRIRVRKVFEKQIRQLIEKNLNKMIEGLNQKIYDDVSAERERLTDDDAVRETLIDSEMLFDEYGNEYDENHIIEFNEEDAHELVGRTILLNSDDEGEEEATILSVIENDNDYEITIEGHSSVEEFYIEKEKLEFLIDNESIETEDCMYGNSLYIELQ